MVLCWIALPVLAVLSLFSVKYRRLTKESLECMFKTVTLRKCSSGLDDRIRSDITGRMMNYSPRTAGFFYNNYKIISWILVIVMLWSVYASASGVYNYYKYGNCNGANGGFCPINILVGSGDKQVTKAVSTVDECLASSNMTLNECLAHCGTLK